MGSSGVLNKFRGCLLGGLVGDCFGRPFENDYPIPKSSLLQFLEARFSFYKTQTGSKIFPYTDDTEMAISVAESLIVNNKFKAEDMVKRFADRYFDTTHKSRGYGNFVQFLFKDFKTKQYKDVFDPAKESFNGTGSLGNGGAMRTHPVALFCHNKNQETFLEICRKTAQLTHAHMDGYNGAILQASAIRLALQADPSIDLDPTAFLGSLEETMTELESKRPPHPKYPSFCAQIEKIRTVLKNPDADPSQLGMDLGNQITAPLSVPSAIYCFLRGQQPLPYYETDNPFVRTLYLAIALGGDTDTIACMACSIAGAFYGLSSIPEVFYGQCEAASMILEQADSLAKIASVH